MAVYLLYKCSLNIYLLYIYILCSNHFFKQNVYVLHAAYYKNKFNSMISVM